MALRSVSGSKYVIGDPIIISHIPVKSPYLASLEICAGRDPPAPPPLPCGSCTSYTPPRGYWLLAEAGSIRPVNYDRQV